MPEMHFTWPLEESCSSMSCFRVYVVLNLVEKTCGKELSMDLQVALYDNTISSILLDYLLKFKIGHCALCLFIKKCFIMNLYDNFYRERFLRKKIQPRQCLIIVSWWPM